MTTCTVCGAGKYRTGHAAWCERVTEALRVERLSCVNGHLRDENGPRDHRGYLICQECQTANHRTVAA